MFLPVRSHGLALKASGGVVHFAGPFFFGDEDLRTVIRGAQEGGEVEVELVEISRKACGAPEGLRDVVLGIARVFLSEANVRFAGFDRAFPTQFISQLHRTHFDEWTRLGDIDLLNPGWGLRKKRRAEENEEREYFAHKNKETSFL